MKHFLERIKTAVRTKPILCHAGMALVYIGAVMLIVSYILGWTNINLLLMCCLLLIAAGIVLHVLALKQESLY